MDSDMYREDKFNLKVIQIVAVVLVVVMFFFVSCQIKHEELLASCLKEHSNPLACKMIQ